MSQLLPSACRLDHKNAIVGWVYRKDDIELEPRFNLGTESLSAGVTYRVGWGRGDGGTLQPRSVFPTTDPVPTP